MRILLIQPPSNYSKEKAPKPALPPLNLMYIAAVLKDNGHTDIEIMDCMAEGYDNEEPYKKDFIKYGLSDDAIRAKIREYKPDIVGVSIMCSLRKYHAYDVCKLAKEVNNDIVTVVGGNPVTCFPKKTLKQNQIDFAILGEGEQPFLNLVEHIKKGKGRDYVNFDGIAYKNNNEEYIIKPQTEWNKDLDKMPFPAHDMIDLDLYLDIWKRTGYQTYEARKFSMSVMARGCPNKCHHCPHKVLFPGYRVRSAQDLFKEMKWAHSLGIREIQYHEYNGLVSWPIVKKFCELMIESGLNKEMRCGWPIGIWLKALTRGRLKLMKKAGMDYVCLAIESYNQETLDETMPGKDVDLKHTLDVIKWCRELDYQIHAFFMLGLEGQTKSDIEKTIDFAKTLDIDTASFFIAQPLPGTPFWDYCKKNDLLYDDFDTMHLRYDRSNHKVTGITKEELEYYRHKGRKDFIEAKGDEWNKIKEKGC